MKKKRKNKRRAIPSSSSCWAPKQVFDEALRLQHKGRSREAWKILKPVAEAEQANVSVLELFIDVCNSLKDFSGLFFAAERLTLQRSEKLDFMALLKSSFELQLPAHLHHSLLTLEQNWPGTVPIGDEKKLREIGEIWVRDTFPIYQKQYPAIRSEDFLELMLLHEKSMVDLGSKRYRSAIEVTTKIIQLFPYFTPAYNNRAMAQVHSCGFSRAAEMIDAALEHDPESLFALGLRARQFGIMDEKEKLESTLKKIHETIRNKESQPDSLTFNQLATAAEAFAFQNREDDVLLLHEKAVELKRHMEGMSHEDEENFGWLTHLSAVALAKNGKKSKAQKRWAEAKEYANSDIIDDNLADMKKPIGSRNGHWYVEFQKIIPEFIFEMLDEAVKQIRKDGSAESSEDVIVRKLCRNIESVCPEFHRYLIKALWDGGPRARDFVRVFGLKYAHPKLIQSVIEFCETSLGTDELRQTLTNRLLNNRHLKAGIAKRWYKGKEKSVILCMFQITHESRIEGILPQKAEKDVAQAFGLMSQHCFVEAAEVFEKILPSVPKYPAAHYNYAICLLLLKEKKQYKKVIEDIYRRFPDYSFGIGAKAGFLLAEGKLDEAEKLTDRLLAMEEHHISEYHMMINLMIALLLAKGQPDAAKSWHKMSLEVLKEKPLPPFKHYLSGKVVHQWE